mmetsp:Transcript_79913/g.207742  ORF Transcript_79913/g.207742 Transcript_79913/m.207742 type:complete len:111 (+) Transcript_79913:64-396(+)
MAMAVAWASCHFAFLALASMAFGTDALQSAESLHFSVENCQGMYETMQKLGGPVPPSQFVAGCNEVCAKVKGLKEYWQSGEMASFACEEGKKYGCIWEGTPPVTLTNIGC